MTCSDAKYTSFILNVPLLMTLFFYAAPDPKTPTYLMRGPSSSRCRKSTRGRSRPKSLWMNVRASWMSTAGSSMKAMVKLIQITSWVLWYLLHSTAAEMNSAR